MDSVYQILIIGGGPAGYSAALYGARAGLSVLVLEKLCAGGQMLLTDTVENYPGIASIAGYSLADAMRSAAEAAGARTLYAQVTELQLLPRRKAAVTSAGTFLGETVILATGAEPKRLDLPGESRLVGRGLHYCAHCDGNFYRGKPVAVVGGGNTALESALYLSGLCSRVYLIHRRDAFRGSPGDVERLQKKPNVEFCLNASIRSLSYTDRLTGLTLSTGKTLSCDGLFVAVGTAPASGLARGQLILDEEGYIMADESTRTNLPGVFAAGDVRRKPLRQIITAAADGAVAATGAQQYLSELS